MKYFSQLDDEVADAQQDDWRGGFDEYSTPTKLGPNTGGAGSDVVVEDNGRPRTRPGADALGGSSLSSGNAISALAYFDTPTVEQVLASLNNGMQAWDGAVWSTPAGYPFGANNIASFAQMDAYIYATSGAGAWYRFDGTNWSASLGTATGAAGDPPVGASILCTHAGRVFAAGTIASTYDTLQASALGNATTGQWDHTNFSIRIGRGEGEAIKALCPTKGQWLAVGKEGSIYLVYTPPQETTAANWVVQRLAGSVGVVGRHALKAGGSSLWCVGPDLALREIVPTQVEDTPFELMPAASEPAKPYFDRINRAAQSTICIHVYGRYLIVGLPLDSATAPSHTLVWNLRSRVASNVPGAGIPAFMGVWTGWTPKVFLTSRFGGVERLLIGDTDGKVNEWKDGEDQYDDATFADNGVDVLGVARTRSWDFGTQRNAKDAESVELQFVDSTAEADVLALLDGEEQIRWGVTLQQVQNQLPLSLPFDLAVIGPTRITRNADSLIEFREICVEVRQTTAGRMELKSVAVAAFLNTSDNE